jgi:putative sugar O-methyltransferase
VGVVVHIAVERSVAQVEDDITLLYRMLADAHAASPIYRPTHYWANYEPLVIERLRAGLHDFRSGPDAVLATFGATDEPPDMLSSIDGVPAEYIGIVTDLVTTLNRALVDDDQVLPYRLRFGDVFDLAYSFCLERTRHAPTIASIDELDVSRVGNPFGFERDGRFVTTSALYYYMRYAFVAEHLDLRDVDVVVELGSGSGKQVEVLQKLHPHLTFVLADLAPQLYVAERYLRAVLPDVAVPYDDTRSCTPLVPEPGKIHFVGNHRLDELAPRGRVLFWNAASFGEMEPDVVAHYAEIVSPGAEWLYLCQCFTGKERAAPGDHGGVLQPVVWSHYIDAFSGHEPVERRPAHTGFAPLVEGVCAYDDTFWTRRA